MCHLSAGGTALNSFHEGRSGLGANPSCSSLQIKRWAASCPCILNKNRVKNYLPRNA
jgi:hypothetical protein